MRIFERGKGSFRSYQVQKKNMEQTWFDNYWILCMVIKNFVFVWYKCVDVCSYGCGCVCMCVRMLWDYKLGVSLVDSISWSPTINQATHYFLLSLLPRRFPSKIHFVLHIHKWILVPIAITYNLNSIL